MTRGSNMESEKLKWGVAVLSAALLLPLSSRAVLADQNDRTHQIGNKLKCMCNGCDQAAGKCYHVGGAYSGPCDTAKTMMKEIDAHITADKSDEQVLQAMIAEYGPLAYMEPPKTGFGLVAWLMPILYLAAGLGLVVMIMKRWRKRPSGLVAAAAGAGAGGGIHVTPEQLARARELSQRESED